MCQRALDEGEETIGGGQDHCIWVLIKLQTRTFVLITLQK